MSTIWMAPRLSEEEQLLKQTVRSFVEEVVNPLEKESRRNRMEVSRQLYREAGKRSLLGLSIPERHGGQGGNAMMEGIAREEIGRSLVVGYGLPFPLNSTYANFAESCAPELVKKWMPKFLAGEARLGFASTEPKSGSDVATIATTAEKTGDSYVISGEKGPVSQSGTSDAWIVLARTGSAEAGSKGVSEFFVENDRPGLETYSLESMEESADLGGIRLNRVGVPADHIVGRENAGFGRRMAIFEIERATIPMAYLGCAMHSLELSIEYSRNRIVWERPIGSFEGVMFPLVEAVTKVESVRSFAYEVLRRHDRGEKITKEASMVRWYVTKVALEALDTCIQVNGAQGYTDAVPHQRRYRWARAGLFGHGTQEIQKLVIGRETMGRDIYDMALGRNRPASKE